MLTLSLLAKQSPHICLKRDECGKIGEKGSSDLTFQTPFSQPSKFTHNDKKVYIWIRTVENLAPTIVPSSWGYTLRKASKTLHSVIFSPVVTHTPRQTLRDTRSS